MKTRILSLLLLAALGGRLFGAGFPNIQRPQAGQLLSGRMVPNQGRTAVIAWHNGLLYTAPESPGSLPGSDIQVRSWNMANPAAPSVLATLGVSRQPVNAHGYFFKNNMLVLGDNVPGAPMSFRATSTYGVNERTTFDAISPTQGVGSRGTMYHPFYVGQTWWSGYSPVNGLATLERNNAVLASWDHLGQTGVIGHPFLFGNLLIFASDQSRTGVAIYDISNQANPVLVGLLKDGGPGGYWPELWGGNGRLYVVWPYQNNLFNDGAPGFRVVDITDPAEPKWVIDKALPAGDEPMYIQFQDNFAFIANHKVDMRTMEVVLTLPSEANGIDTSQFALPLGNLLVTGGYGDQQGLAVWAHQTAPDTHGPEVGFHIPRANQTNYPLNAPISLLIHETLEAGTIINSDTFSVQPLDAGGNPGGAIAGEFTLAFDDTLTFTPAQPLQANTTYQVTLREGGITDAAGNGMVGYSFTFSTGTTVGGNTPPVISSLSADQSVVAPGGTLQFTALASDAPGQAIEYRFDAGDGRPKTEWAAANQVSFTYAQAGHYRVVVQVRDPLGSVASRPLGVNVLQVPAGAAPRSSGPVAVDAANRRIWTVNPDANSVTAVNADTLAKLFEVPVGKDPRSIAVAPNGEVWVACQGADRIEVLSGSDGVLSAQIATGYGSAPFGVVLSADGAHAYVSLHGSGRVRRYARASRQQTGDLALGPTARALALSGDGGRLLVTRFISPLNRGEVWEVETGAFTLSRTLVLPKLGDALHLDGTANGRGVPNYLASVVIAPDNQSAWVAATKPNTERGTLFGEGLDPDNTMRTTLLRLDLAGGYVSRDVDLDNSDSASGLALSPRGDYLFATLQGNNEVAVFDVLALDAGTGLGGLINRVGTGAAPQGVAVDALTGRVAVHNFMGRSLSVLEAATLFEQGSLAPATIAVSTVATEPLAPAVLQGKRLFYFAGDPRMSAEGYISCASCHVDGGSDGRTWDFTQRGEGLRNTPELRGRAGTGHGNVHWTANFDEIQDFENDIRTGFGGTGFLSAAQYAATADPLGAPKAGLSPELDALAAYVASLGLESLARSPYRPADGTLSAAALAGREVFQALNCASCHSGSTMARAAVGSMPVLDNVGTIRSTSGQRRGGPLTGFDPPTLLGVWAGAPYFHDGSAKTLEEVFTVSAGEVIGAQNATVTEGSLEYPGVQRSNFRINFDNSIMGDRMAVVYSGGRITFSGVNGGAGGLGALELRYSASAPGSTAFVRVNGVAHLVATAPTGNWPLWRPTFWETVRVENVMLQAGTANTVEIGLQTGWILAVNHLVVSTSSHLQAASSHRIVQAQSAGDRANLLQYLRELDRSGVIAAAIVSYLQYVQDNGLPAGATGELDDHDHNGLPNILEYGFGTDRISGGHFQSHVVSVPELPGNPAYLAVSFRARKRATDLRYVVERSSDLVTWEAVVTYEPTANGELIRTGGGQSVLVSHSDEGETVLVAERNAEPISAAQPQAFARVRITRVP